MTLLPREKEGFDGYNKAEMKRTSDKKKHNSVLIIFHITVRHCRVHIFPTTFLKEAACKEI